MPEVTDPEIVRFAGSIRTVESVDPTSELALRTSSEAGLSAGKVKRAEPVRAVAVRSAETPDARRTRYRPGSALSSEWLKSEA
ncbi:hypothetical protein SCHAM137S_04233 [Streptomyces chartreusis]